MGRLRVTRFAHGGFVSALSNNMVNVLPAAPDPLSTHQPEDGSAPIRLCSVFPDAPDPRFGVLCNPWCGLEDTGREVRIC